jgi:hypothetical protein
VLPHAGPAFAALRALAAEGGGCVAAVLAANALLVAPPEAVVGEAEAGEFCEELRRRMGVGDEFNEVSGGGEDPVSSACAYALGSVVGSNRYPSLRPRYVPLLLASLDRGPAREALAKAAGMSGDIAGEVVPEIADRICSGGTESAVAASRALEFVLDRGGAVPVKFFEESGLTVDILRSFCAVSADPEVEASRRLVVEACIPHIKGAFERCGAGVQRSVVSFFEPLLGGGRRDKLDLARVELTLSLLATAVAAGGEGGGGGGDAVTSGMLPALTSMALDPSYKARGPAAAVVKSVVGAGAYENSALVMGLLGDAAAGCGGDVAATSNLVCVPRAQASEREEGVCFCGKAGLLSEREEGVGFCGKAGLLGEREEGVPCCVGSGLLR